MKTQKQKITVTLIAFFIAMLGHSQKTYLKITKSNIENDIIMYPPGTEFQLKTKQGYIIFKNSDGPGKIDVDEEYTLYVYPTWKDDPDVFILTEGFVEKVLTSTYSSHQNGEDISSNGVTATITVSDSDEREGKKNLVFKLSNGITFKYEDEKYRAYLIEETNYIRITGKYLIATELGTLKISFNPKNGLVWWIFEKKNS